MFALIGSTAIAIVPVATAVVIVIVTMTILYKKWFATPAYAITTFLLFFCKNRVLTLADFTVAELVFFPVDSATIATTPAADTIVVVIITIAVSKKGF